MKITCNRTDLASAISSVQRAVSTKSNIPALTGILLTTRKDGLELVGYDCDMGIRTTIEAQVDEPGAACLAAKLLGEIVRKLDGDEVHIEVDAKHMATVKCGRSRFSLVGVDPATYPDIPKIEEKSSLSMENKTLKNMIRQTVFAVADNNAKPIHTGALFEIKGTAMRMVGCDGYRLAIREENIGGEHSEITFVVPKKSLQEVSKLLPDDDKQCKISIDSRRVTFSVGSYIVFSKLLEGEFLDYRAAIPKQSATEVEVKTEELIASVERVSLMITDRLKSPIRCQFSGDDGHMNLSSYTPIGHAADQLQASIQGETIEIGFNNRYLLDALQNSETDVVRLALKGSLYPMTIRPKGGNSFLFIVLPVRLKPQGEV